MNADFNIKPVGVSVSATYVAPASDAAKAAVPTQLPANKTVTATDAAVSAQMNAQAEQDRLSHQVVMDSAAAELIFQVVNSQTDFVVSQIPDEAQVRARAYIRTLDAAKENDTPVSSTDVTA